jgi:hypothetical protein
MHESQSPAGVKDGLNAATVGQEKPRRAFRPIVLVSAPVSLQDFQVTFMKKGSNDNRKIVVELREDRRLTHS